VAGKQELLQLVHDRIEGPHVLPQQQIPRGVSEWVVCQVKEAQLHDGALIRVLQERAQVTGRGERSVRGGIRITFSRVVGTIHLTGRHTELQECVEELRPNRAK